MAHERDEEPKIRIVDRRMLNDDERAGKGAAAENTPESAAAQPEQKPRLEVIGGGQPAASTAASSGSASSSSASSGSASSGSADTPSAQADAPSAGFSPAAGAASTLQEGDEAFADEEGEISEEEMQQMRNEVEAQQFAALEERIGRPLTEQEKDAVRDEMEKRARSAAALEVAPMLQQLLQELHAHAMVHMGMMPNPYTQLIAKNDSEARLAIDSFGAILELIKSRLEPALEREYSRVLNDMRVNYVNQTGLPAGGFPNFGSSSDGPKIIH